MSEHIIYLLGPFSLPSLKPRYARVYIPPPRAHGPRPILYLFDGQNMFHDEPSYAGGWHLHKTADRLVARGERVPILVGIDHGGEARIDELSPFPNQQSQGQLDILLDWMTQELVPLIAREHGASIDPCDTGIGGSSMGGLAALYAHFRHPDRFGRAMSMSPSLFVGDGALFDYIASRPRPPDSRIYLDAGALEARGHLLASATRLANQLRDRGYDDRSLLFVASKRGAHSEKHWRRRAPRAISFLFNSSAR